MKKINNDQDKEDISKYSALRTNRKQKKKEINS